MQTSPHATKSRPDAQTLSRALTIAWDLLVAADDPATAGERLTTRTAKTAERQSDWLKEARAALDNRPAEWRDVVSHTAGRLHPAEVFRALRPFVERDPDTVLICDGGEFA